jgi:hypothetical protein
VTDQTPDLTEPDNPAAYALARHIADHPVSTIQAAFRYLNAPLTVELHDSVSSAVVQSALAETAVRDRIAEALSEARRPGLGGMTEADAVAHMAAAVLAVLPAADRPAEEAYRLAVSAALRLGTDATWEAIRDRAEDLTAEVQQLTEASRRLLKQRQEMAAERFAWQERGDRAEARVRQLEAVASVDRAAVLNEAAGAIAADAALRETEGEYALAEYGYELARLIRPKELADLPAVVPAGAGEEPADETPCCVCGAPVEWMDVDVAYGSGWIHSPDSDTPCLNARPRCPDCQMPHNLTPGSVPVAACEGIRRRIAEAEQLHGEGDHRLCCRADCAVLRSRADAEQPKEARP